MESDAEEELWLFVQARTTTRNIGEPITIITGIETGVQFRIPSKLINIQRDSRRRNNGEPGVRRVISGGYDLLGPGRNKWQPAKGIER